MKRDKFEIIAKTFQGVEEQLAEEIKTIGGEEIALGRRMVSFKGDNEMLYRANFFCRTALRILKPIYKFEAKDTDELYEKVKNFNWGEFLTPKSTFAIDAVVYSEDFKHSKFATYRTKDAIVDYFSEKGEERPSVRLTNTDIMLNLHIAHHTCTISLDSSGESLHKRGYRIAQTEAPINEVLAAAMLMKAGWNGTKNLLDPMCGSGTILIEAALIATNTPPGIYRNGYAFERWSDFDPSLFESIFNDDHKEREFTNKIYGSDISAKAIDVARQNIKNAKLEKYIELEIKPIQKYTSSPENCVLITNPPYGERLSPRDLLDIYLTFGSQLKHVFTGCEAWIISSSREGFENIGLKPAVKIPMMNGSIECEFRKYEIFDGKYNDYKKELAEGGKPNRGRTSDYNRPERRERPTNYGASDRREKPAGYSTPERRERPSNFERPERREKTDYPVSQDKKSFRFDERKPLEPKREPTVMREPRQERTFGNDFEGENANKSKIHGEEFVSKFVTFRQPTLGGESGAKQFRKRKKKEE
ncbi:MAG: THUMP domain-containing protein [Bacteroidales bacterium]